MIAILSPAKSLDYDTPRDMPPATEPRFQEQTAQLIAAAQKMSVQDIMEKMKISQALGELNHGRYQGFADLPALPAIQVFDGDVYTGLNASTFSKDDILFAQDHLRILSGLYGMLRPLDRMKPYRLEMGTKRFPEDKKLSIWWDDHIAKIISDDADKAGERAILNLASQEYYASIKGRLPEDIRVVDVEFIAADGRFITMHAKVARGVMARWMVENRISKIDDMRAFDAAGYVLDEKQSTDNNWIYRRAASEDGPPA